MLTPQRRLGRLLSAAAVALAFAGGAGLTPALATPAQAALPQIRGIAVVDMQKVLSDTKQGQSARKKLEDSSKAKQEKLDQKRKKLEADTGKLKNLSGVYTVSPCAMLTCSAPTATRTGQRTSAKSAARRSAGSDAPGASFFPANPTAKCPMNIESP